jgi:hypothetical protein
MRDARTSLRKIHRNKWLQLDPACSGTQGSGSFTPMGITSLEWKIGLKAASWC